MPKNLNPCNIAWKVHVYVMIYRYEDKLQEYLEVILTSRDEKSRLTSEWVERILRKDYKWYGPKMDL